SLTLARSSLAPLRLDGFAAARTVPRGFAARPATHGALASHRASRLRRSSGRSLRSRRPAPALVGEVGLGAA
ncbi:hypothetical protein U6M47_12430, partial [Cutibacterium acnes]